MLYFKVRKDNMNALNFSIDSWLFGNVLICIVCSIQKKKKGKVEYFKLPINALLKKGQIPATLWAFFKDAIFDLNEYQSFVDSMIAKYSSEGNFRPFFSFSDFLRIFKVEKNCFISHIWWHKNAKLSNYADLRTLECDSKTIWAIALDAFSFMVFKQNAARPGHYFLPCSCCILLQHHQTKNIQPLWFQRYSSKQFLFSSHQRANCK